MKYFLILILLGISVSCKRIGDHVVLPVSTEDIKATQELKEKQDTCFFKKEKLTDSYLKGVKELEGYTWNNKTKIALKEISDKETIQIYRGGCEELFFETTIILNNENKFSHELINQKIIKIAELFPKEYELILIKECLKTNCLNMTQENLGNYYGNFMKQELYESLTVYFKVENSKTYITLETYL